MKLSLNRGITILFAIVLVLLCNSMNSLTGPSTIESEIKPISINKKGEVLCKTRFTKNEMGAYSPIKIEYGFCIISKDTIIEIKTKTIDPTPESSYYEQKDYWDSIFRSETSQQQLNDIKEVILKNKYSFPSTNINSYKVNKILSVSDFETTKNVSLKKNKQKGLFGASSTEYYNEKKVHLLYDFGSIILFNNTNNIDYEELELGSDFDYYNPWIDDMGKEINIGFEVNIITGILIIE
ncbi:hypothetical protein ATE84_4059 [Aquimarina sp. MAR_2010_214]|uniref:hypothetical protein n=1 Tax=Aquimarina sp. MAR_2010_214 TaxID=1250026 RepID=UPI000C703D0E|nr:hypothetical protein [Aquimarina sp. MAR_2010_214]PKV51959.1 hypothetical protein ATE84_4059 [Aquimarina sp. MAR_2010_214]